MDSLISKAQSGLIRKKFGTTAELIAGVYAALVEYLGKFPLAEGTPPRQLLEHLNLLNEGRLTNAAVLLFGKQPQRFLICSEIRCAHFHGTEVAKPIPSYPVYKGAAFDLVDQAVDFVLSKINRAIGTRVESARAASGVHRTHGDGNLGHDRSLRRCRVARASVRRYGWIRDDGLASASDVSRRRAGGVRWATTHRGESWGASWGASRIER